MATNAEQQQPVKTITLAQYVSQARSQINGVLDNILGAVNRTDVEVDMLKAQLNSIQQAGMPPSSVTPPGEVPKE